VIIEVALTPERTPPGTPEPTSTQEDDAGALGPMRPGAPSSLRCGGRETTPRGSADPGGCGGRGGGRSGSDGDGEGGAIGINSLDSHGGGNGAASGSRGSGCGPVNGSVGVTRKQRRETSPMWAYFTRSIEPFKVGQAPKAAFCSFCAEAGVPTRVCGRPEVMANHLLCCKAAHADEAWEAIKVAVLRVRGKRLHRPSALQPSPSGVGPMSQYLQAKPMKERTYKMFEEDLLKVALYCGFSFNAMQSPPMRNFLLNWVAGLTRTPTRHDLGEDALLGVRNWASSEALQAYLVGVFTTVMMDGWKSKASKKILGSLASNVNKSSGMFAIDLLGTKDISELSETTNLVFSFVDNEIQQGLAAGRFRLPGPTHEPSAALSVLVGVNSDSASSCVSAKRLLKVKYPGLITAPCAAHQINLLMVNVLTQPAMKEVSAKCCLLVKFSSKSPFFMAHLRKITFQLQHRQLSFKKKGETR